MADDSNNETEAIGWVKRIKNGSLEGLSGGVNGERLRLKRGSLRTNRGLEAPGGFEPPHRSFADCSLSHLGTAPRVGL